MMLSKNIIRQQAFSLISEAHFNLGCVYTQKRNLGLAIESFKKALEIKPDWIEAHTNLGAAYEANDMFNDAMEEYRKALGLNPGIPESHTNLGNLYFKMENLMRPLRNMKWLLNLSRILRRRTITLAMFISNKVNTALQLMSLRRP